MKTSFYKTASIILLFLFSAPFFSLAQGPGDDGTCDTCEEEVPLDNWLIFLLIAGVLYGLYKFRMHRKHTR